MNPPAFAPKRTLWTSYRVFIKYCVFSLKFCEFSELCQFCCSAGVLPAWCVYTHWRRGKTEKDQSPEYFKIFEKNTIFNEHPVYYPFPKTFPSSSLAEKLTAKICRSVLKPFLITKQEIFWTHHIPTVVQHLDYLYSECPLIFACALYGFFNPSARMVWFF